MCSKSSSSSSSPASRKKGAKSTKKSATIDSRKLSTKTRTRTRKPKYLSLKLELFPSQQQKQQQKKKKTKIKTKTPQKPSSKTMPETTKQQQQLNLFPLHPENMVLDLSDDHQQVAFLLETATDSSTSLQSLLDISSNTTSTTTTTTTAATPTTSEDDPLSLYRGQQDRSEEVECGGGPSLLIRTAMRCKERDASEERWVSYCEVVKKEPEEVISDRDYKINSLEFNINPAAADEEQGKKMGLVGLKLDYEEILNAWSDKGSLFIEGESPQTVPDLQDIVSLDNGLGSMMRVPDMGGMKMEKGQREASVLRYKEKRQSRLFSKRIRYEVRKLNAEKRPRLKGRFVKRSGEE